MSGKSSIEELPSAIRNVSKIRYSRKLKAVRKIVESDQEARVFRRAALFVVEKRFPVEISRS